MSTIIPKKEDDDDEKESTSNQNEEIEKEDINSSQEEINKESNIEKPPQTNTKQEEEEEEEENNKVKNVSNGILFYGITYLGQATVQAPKNENEINKIIKTLNSQGQEPLEVILSVPQAIDDNIILFDKSSDTSKIAEYRMSQILFVLSGQRSSVEANCFAFTTYHSDSAKNRSFPCHVFRCNLADAVSKILHSFYVVFNRQAQAIANSTQQQQQQQQSQQQQQQQQKLQKNDGSSRSISQSITGATVSSVASSLFGSLYNTLPVAASFSGSNQSNNANNQYSTDFAQFALEFEKGKPEEQ
jgi:hypothetical protein